jgi:hypothetical protein
MADATEQTTEQTTTTTTSDDLIPRAEAKKAFEARDKVKKELQALMESGRVLSEEQIDRYKALEATAAKAEEDRKRKAGEWDSLRTQLAEKHANELKERDSKLSTLSERFKSTVVRAEFGATTDYFGGSETSKTILDVDLGMAALGRYVHVEDTDDEVGYRVVVKKPNGDLIIGDDGNPAPFADAIGELIKLLPNKDRILRGSGKTGSGNSGGSKTTTSGVIDTRRLRPGDFNDPKVREAVRREQNAAGGLQIGRAFDRR